jgi:DNA-binding transcriptional ArsR family regulator
MNAITALADPTRRRIVEILAAGPRPSGEIAAQFDLSAPAISQHLKTLRAARLVRVRAEAQRRIYEIDLRGVNELSDWLEHVRSFWAPRLDALEKQLTNEKE